MRCVYLGPLSGATLAGLLCIMLSVRMAHPQLSLNPYRDIAHRNVFALKEPPAAAPFPQPPLPRNAPGLLLTGVADFSTAKWAFITRTDPGQPPATHTLTLGEIEGGLQLLSLDANSATAIVRVDGMETVTLQLATNQLSKVTAASQFVSKTPLGR